MKVTRVQAEANRRRVVAAASEAFRARGFDGIGIAKLMQAAGLTHGGFYGQFGSREELEAEAVAEGFAASERIFDEAAAAPAGAAFPALVRAYLSGAHRDAVAKGCPLAALGPDAGRRGAPVREAFGLGLRDRVERVRELLARDGRADGRAEAMAACATLVGALVMARAVDDRPLSDAVLAAAVGALTADGAG